MLFWVLVYLLLTGCYGEYSKQCENNNLFDSLNYALNVIQFNPNSNHRYLKIYKSLLLEANLLNPVLILEKLSERVFVPHNVYSECKQYLIPFAANVTYFLQKLHLVVERREKANNMIKVIVIGAGPLGMVNALASYLSGAEVTVLEKRLDYTRNTWFDLGPNSMYPTLQILEELGLNYQIFEKVERWIESNQLYTVRCQILERFLLKVLMFANINVNFGYEFISFFPSTKNTKSHVLASQHYCSYYFLQKYTCNSLCIKYHKFDFDILIGADGFKSDVRKYAKIDFIAQESFRMFGKYFKKVKDLKQVTIIANFESENGECPPIKKDDNGNEIDYIYPSFEVEGVTLVFKRWFYGHCHLQICKAFNY